LSTADLVDLGRRRGRSKQSEGGDDVAECEDLSAGQADQVQRQQNPSEQLSGDSPAA
jgi:hypothetical protein